MISVGGGGGNRARGAGLWTIMSSDNLALRPLSRLKKCGSGLHGDKGSTVNDSMG